MERSSEANIIRTDRVFHAEGRGARLSTALRIRGWPSSAVGDPITGSGRKGGQKFAISHPLL
jgi:hypothetical protein